MFGGTILSIVFNSTTGVNANNTDPDADADYYSDVDYDINKSLNLKVPEQILVTSSIDEQQLGIIYAVTEKGLCVNITISNKNYRLLKIRFALCRTSLLMCNEI